MFAYFMKEVGQVLMMGLIFGAGLPMLFSFGIKAMAEGAGGDAEISHAAGNPAYKIVGYVCFALVALCILMGIALVISSGMGYKVSFGSGYPTFTK